VFWLIGRLNPVIIGASSSIGVVPIMSPVPRRDSNDMRGRAGTFTSVNGEQPNGLERVIESLKIENGEAKKLIRELDDRCTTPLPTQKKFLTLGVDRCKLAECERQKEEIQSLRMEISLLQRRASIAGMASSPATSLNADGNSSPTPVPSNVATRGSPDTKKSETTTEEKNPSDGSHPGQIG